MIKINLGIALENTAPNTELYRIFCAGIASLQHGVVLVLGICQKARYRKATFGSEEIASGGIGTINLSAT